MVLEQPVAMALRRIGHRSHQQRMLFIVCLVIISIRPVCHINRAIIAALELTWARIRHHSVASSLDGERQHSIGNKAQLDYFIIIFPTISRGDQNHQHVHHHMYHHYPPSTPPSAHSQVHLRIGVSSIDFFAKSSQCKLTNTHLLQLRRPNEYTELPRYAHALYSSAFRRLRTLSQFVRVIEENEMHQRHIRGASMVSLHPCLNRLYRSFYISPIYFLSTHEEFVCFHWFWLVN